MLSVVRSRYYIGNISQIYRARQWKYWAWRWFAQGIASTGCAHVPPPVIHAQLFEKPATVAIVEAPMMRNVAMIDPFAGAVIHLTERADKFFIPDPSKAGLNEPLKKVDYTTDIVNNELNQRIAAPKCNAGRDCRRHCCRGSCRGNDSGKRRCDGTQGADLPRRCDEAGARFEPSGRPDCRTAHFPAIAEYPHSHRARRASERSTLAVACEGY